VLLTCQEIDLENVEMTVHFIIHLTEHEPPFQVYHIAKHTNGARGSCCNRDLRHDDDALTAIIDVPPASSFEAYVKDLVLSSESEGLRSTSYQHEHRFVHTQQTLRRAKNR
jgi:hypothetical protein